MLAPKSGLYLRSVWIQKVFLLVVHSTLSPKSIQPFRKGQSRLWSISRIRIENLIEYLNSEARKNHHYDTVFDFISCISDAHLKGSNSDWGPESESDLKFKWNLKIGGFENSDFDLVFNFFSNVKLVHWKDSNLGFKSRIGVGSKFWWHFRIQPLQKPYADTALNFFSQVK